MSFMLYFVYKIYARGIYNRAPKWYKKTIGNARNGSIYNYIVLNKQLYINRRVDMNIFI